MVSLNEVVGSFVLPSRFSALRVSTGFGAAQTAVANPYKEYPITPQNLGQNSYLAGFFFRDALRASMIVDPNVNALDAKYDLVTNDVLDAYFAPGVTRAIVPAYWQRDATYSTYAPHDDFLYCGENGCCVGTWVDFGCALNINTGASTIAANGDVSVNTYYWDGRNFHLYSNTSFTSAAPGTLLQVPIADPGYYKWEVVVKGSANSFTYGAVYLNGYNNCNEIWGHHALQGLEDNYQDTQALQVQVVGVTCRNTTSNQYMNGQASVVQLSKNKDPLEFVNNGNPLSQLYSQLTGLKGSAVQTFKTSFYTYLKTLEPKDLDFLYPFSTNTAYGQSIPTGTVGYFQLRPRAGWLAVAAQFSSGTSTVAATSTQFRVEWGLQFETTNTWLATGSEEVSAAQLDQALRVVARLPQLVEGSAADLKLSVV